MRANSVVRSIWPGISANPGAITYSTTGMAMIMITLNTSKAAAKTAKASSANCLAFCLPSRASVCVNIGTKLAEKAPSANRLRNRFGN